MIPMVYEDIVKCKQCNETLIFEECDSHTCSPTLNGKTVKADLAYYMVLDNQKGEPTILAKDMDGTLYSFINKQNKRIFFSNTISSRFKQLIYAYY